MRAMARRRGIILPYSAAHETGANVPILRHFFPFTETSGLNVTDIKGGVVWAVPGITFVDGRIGTSAHGTDNPTPLVSGSWHSFASGESIVFCAAGKIVGDGGVSASVRFSIGDINNALSGSTGIGMGLSDAPFHTALGKNGGLGGPQTRRYLLSGDTLYLPGFGQNVIIIAKYIPGTSISYVAYNAETSAVILTADTTNTGGIYSADSGAFQPFAAMRMHGMEMHGAAIFSSTNGLPANIDRALFWQGSRWVAGDRSVAPDLIGIE